MATDAGEDTFPEVIEDGATEDAVDRGGGDLSEELRRGRGAAAADAHLLLAMAIVVGGQGDGRQLGDGISAIDIAEDLALEGLVEGIGGGLIADHRGAEG